MSKPQENWEIGFDKEWRAGFIGEKYAEELKSFISSLLSSERQRLIAKIDKVYKKEKGIHNWLDLRDKLLELKYENNNLR